MNNTQAFAIIDSLANGVDPETGEVYPPESPYQRAHIVRAMFVARQALEQAAARESRKDKLPGNTGKPWTAEEDTQLCEGYDGGAALVALARTHDRTRGSIQARLVRLGKIRA